MNQINFHTKVAGVTFTNPDGVSRQDLIEDLEDFFDGSTTVRLGLRREPHNAFDENAVAVLDPRGRQLGYLSKRVSETVAPIMDRGTRVHATLTAITGAGLSQNYGVNIRLHT